MRWNMHSPAVRVLLAGPDFEADMWTGVSRDMPTVNQILNPWRRFDVRSRCRGDHPRISQIGVVDGTVRTHAPSAARADIRAMHAGS